MFATFTYKSGDKVKKIYVNPDHVMSFSSSDQQLTALQMSDGTTQVVSEPHDIVAGRLTTVRDAYRSPQT